MEKVEKGNEGMLEVGGSEARGEEGRDLGSGAGKGRE